MFSNLAGELPQLFPLSGAAGSPLIFVQHICGYPVSSKFFNRWQIIACKHLDYSGEKCGAILDSFIAVELRQVEITGCHRLFHKFHIAVDENTNLAAERRKIFNNPSDLLRGN